MRAISVAGCILAVGLSACAPNPTEGPIESSDATAAESEMSVANEQSSAEPEQATTSPATDPAADSGEQSADVDVTILDWDQVVGEIAARKGTVVVVDLWSTDCVPCLREFPHLVALQNKYPEQVSCISVSLDYIGLKAKPPESYRSKVVKFLREQNAKMFNVISSVDSDRLFERLGLGSIPAVYVYSQDGELAKRFDDDEGLYGPEGFTYEQQITPFVEELLKQ